MSLNIKIKRLKPEAKLPSYVHIGDVGMDVYSMEHKIVEPGEHYIFFLGFAMEFPVGYAAIMTDKSSISKAGLHVMGGVYDAGYRGEYNVHLVNLSKKSYTVEKGDKISQIIVHPIEIAKIEETDTLTETERGVGSFGSTGRK